MATPDLRFPEFTEEWKEIKLSDLVTRVMRKNSNNETDLPLTISSIDGLVDQRTYFSKTIASKDMSGYYLLKKGEFAYNKSYSVGFDYGSIKRLDKYDCGALSTLYICFALKDDSYSDFLTKYFDSLKWNEEVSLICAEGARNHGLLNVPIKEFFDITLYIPPTVEERDKIVEFLNLIETKVHEQRAIVENLQLQKQGIIQRLLKQELRFPNLDGTAYSDWKEVKLSQILKEYREKCPKNGTYEHVSLTKEGVVPKTERYDREHLVTHEDKEYRVTHLNDICYNPANLKFGVICKNSYGDAIFSPIYVTFKVNEQYSPDFIEILLTQEDFINYALRYQEGTVYERMSVSPENLLSITVKVPCIEEQKQIADFISTLNKKIEIENNILKDLEHLQFALLQQMFI